MRPALLDQQPVVVASAASVASVVAASVAVGPAAGLAAAASVPAGYSVQLLGLPHPELFAHSRLVCPFGKPLALPGSSSLGR